MKIVTKMNARGRPVAFIILMKNSTNAILSPLPLAKCTVNPANLRLSCTV